MDDYVVDEKTDGLFVYRIRLRGKMETKNEKKIIEGRHELEVTDLWCIIKRIKICGDEREKPQQL